MRCSDLYIALAYLLKNDWGSCCQFQFISSFFSDSERNNSLVELVIKTKCVKPTTFEICIYTGRISPLAASPSRILVITLQYFFITHYMFSILSTLFEHHFLYTRKIRQFCLLQFNLSLIGIYAILSK